ncbi:MAG: 50S ribosomal protein L3 [Candidatus Komeilibacteria bacterium]|nr:50S ribosomal protein L3 [Candidatus Komeilibacteria bacterium]
MMKFILGKKIGMSQIFQETGEVIPVTVIQAGPCKVTQVKNKDKDGYTAVQLGFEPVKKISKPKTGHLKDLPLFRYLREFRISGETFERGQEITIQEFSPKETLKVTGFSKGKGFQGVVKRHGFHGHPTTHGHKDQMRMPGSIGATFPQHVIKGKRMGGRMGGEQITTANLEVVSIEAEKNLLYVKGAVPGGRNSFLLIKTAR